MSTRANPTRPDVSVVMPVFNKLELTRVCLESLGAVGAEASFEIIVVDNGSTDGSREWLTEQQQSGRVRLVLNPENLGFSQGCNLGAKAAQGRYILFLNNDMEVLPGWLDPMVSTLDRDPEVGIVGAKLLFADNTIQHAGVALVEFASQDHDLGGIHQSYRKPAQDPCTTRPQYQQIVTGACMLIRPEVFAAVEGFGEEYWNGNEDVDLCLKAGQLGWKVVYRPESVIYHYESQSGPERWAQTQRNVERFNARWKGVARPDFLHYTDDDLRATPHLAIRNYVMPRLTLTRPCDETGPVVSVVVLTWNALDYTRKCAESLLRHTDPRHELLFVDNGSRQDTLDYLADLERGHPQVRVIRNGENLGFAAGNNVGIVAARGDYVCLLNSDTVVTAGWLEALLAPAEKDPKVGLVGPVTNSISGGQKLPSVPYDQDTLAGLTEFAARRGAEEAGRTQTALMIVGFCMLMKKSLIERIGGLDEGFGQGNYEDTDYCLRTILAGFNAVVAFDSFVHHFGSRSFVEGKVDYGAQIDEKFQIFRRKWNLEAGARSTANLDLKKLLTLGYIPGLYYCPLPTGPGQREQGLDSWEAERWLKIGEAFFGNGRLDDAARIFRAVRHFAPDNLRAANNLACALWQVGSEDHKAQAVSLLEEILARHPDDEDARWNLQEMAGNAVSEPVV